MWLCTQPYVCTYVFLHAEFIIIMCTKNCRRLLKNIIIFKKKPESIKIDCKRLLGKNKKCWWLRWDGSIA